MLPLLLSVKDTKTKTAAILATPLVSPLPSEPSRTRYARIPFKSVFQQEIMRAGIGLVICTWNLRNGSVKSMAWNNSAEVNRTGAKMSWNDDDKQFYWMSKQWIWIDLRSYLFKHTVAAPLSHWMTLKKTIFRLMEKNALRYQAPMRSPAEHASCSKEAKSLLQNYWYGCKCLYYSRTIKPAPFPQYQSDSWHFHRMGVISRCNSEAQGS